ncbi:hypothetical protein HPB50_027105 [Hyalomma asiaticum]|uniref:Uncharacterized protein n=1 Tax=Hyalomma asiaticum TaxID=266040 RepID=A0ACB7T647_HYAAI|nr:hypothetical protein HPB50_027105 [Hyalomma asiaticum]
MPLEDMVFGEDISRQEDETSGWIVAHSRKKRRQDFTPGDSPGPNAANKQRGKFVPQQAAGSRFNQGGEPGTPGRGAGHRSRSRNRSASCVRNQQGPTWADRVGHQRGSRTIVQRQLPEQDTARIQQLERENATLRSELQEIKALVEELRQRERMADAAVNAQQADAQPRGGKRKAADPPVDYEKEFSDIIQEIAGVEVNNADLNDANERIAEETMQALKVMGGFGMQVPPELGGIGATNSQTARLSETIGQYDLALGITLGAHQVRH